MLKIKDVGMHLVEAAKTGIRGEIEIWASK
jgi:hypothetical protein